MNLPWIQRRASLCHRQRGVALLIVMLLIFAMAVIVTAFAYTNFETKLEAERREITIKERLERMESKQDKQGEKIDQLLERRR